jgi:hypothetical protein
MRVRAAPSLRLTLLAGAALIAALAVAAAGLTAWGNARTARLIAAATEAQARIELLAQASARVGDYALVALDGASAGLDPVAREARLAPRADAVRAALGAFDAALARAVAAAASRSEAAQTALAARSLGLARMRSSFESLARTAPESAAPMELRARLDSFATLFAPLLNDAIEAERRAARGALVALEAHRAAVQRLAAAIALGAAAALAFYHLVLVRPLLGRLGRVAAAAEAVGSGELDRTPPVDRRDELGLVFAQIRRMAARLRRARDAVARDRARLEEIVAERTAALSAANARLAGVDAERRRLFADVGHELRTPLTVILAETELTAGGAEAGPEEMRAALGVIRARARRLNRRIEDLLRVARSESGQLELEARPFDLAAAAREAVEDAAPLARRAKVRLAPPPPCAAAPAALGDPDWTRQVIAGVLENAIRHSAAGDTIEVALAAEAGRIEARITDEGDGVRAADQGRIFERHARGASRGLGFGVGLALARWVMEAQGGRVALESPAPRPAGAPAGRGPGARVTLTLPATGAGA